MAYAAGEEWAQIRQFDTVLMDAIQTANPDIKENQIRPIYETWRTALTELAMVRTDEVHNEQREGMNVLTFSQEIFPFFNIPHEHQENLRTVLTQTLRALPKAVALTEEYYEALLASGWTENEIANGRRSTEQNPLETLTETGSQIQTFAAWKEGTLTTKVTDKHILAFLSTSAEAMKQATFPNGAYNAMHYMVPGGMVIEATQGYTE